MRLGDKLSNDLSEVAWTVKGKAIDVLDYGKRDAIHRFLKRESLANAATVVKTPLSSPT